MISAERALGLAPDPVRRLAALAVAVTEDAKRVAARLRLSNAETKMLDSMGHRWWRLAGMDELRARQRLYRLAAGQNPDRPNPARAPSSESVRAGHWLEIPQLTR